MGGNAFAPALYTPRMPPPVYEAVLQDTLNILRRRFFRVADAPIPGPGKLDHGDIDILVTAPFDLNTTIEDIARELEAVDHKTTAGSSTTHLAIPWPRRFEHVITASRASAEVESKYIQVDLSIQPTQQSLNYTLFHHAHGDFWNIVGATIRPYGLTISTTGLFIRIAEVEPHNKNQARVLLTSDPIRILTFLGLDPSKFWTPCSTLDDMMDYASTCRFFHPARYQSSSELKGNDRAREKKRDGFRYWTQDYLPQHRESAQIGDWAQLTREEVVQLATTHFNVADEYNSRKETQMRIVGVDQLWADIRKIVSADEDVEVGYVMKGLKRVITADVGTEAEADPEGRQADNPELCRAQEGFRYGWWDEVLAYAKRHYQEVGARQKRMDQATSRAKLLEKLERDRVVEERAQNQAVLRAEPQAEPQAEAHR